MDKTTDKPTTKSLPLWDIWIRLFHWSLAISVGFMLLSGETGFGFFEWHRLVGEIVLCLVLFRVLWSIFGSSNASLIALIKSPNAAVLHLKELFTRTVRPEPGHNAAGGWAVLAVLVLLAIQAITGFFIADEDEFIEGAFYDSIDTDLSYLMYDIHHTVATFIQIIVAVHIIAILSYWIWAKLNLIPAMISGRQKWPDELDRETIVWQPFWKGLLCLAASVAIIGTLAGWFS
ncbi:MAG: cytochrome b/b6 domain-containing protein [Gammaproteobacteria bacterium]|nr:cytochrome b/b6 domain-containing protein [Gammaproteobacteria bacterium]